MPRRGTFQLASKNIFLTYPQCSLSKEACLDQIKALQFSIPPSYIRVASEMHENGDPHLHCLIQFDAKFQTTNKRFFDVSSPSSNNIFHPNIQGARDAAAVQSYISKHGDYVEFGTFSNDKRFKNTDMNTLYNAALATNDVGMSIEMIRAHDCKTMVCNYDRIVSHITRILKKPQPPYVARFPTFTSVHDSLTLWAQINVTNVERRLNRPLSAIIEGPSRLEKTCWARYIGPHNYYMGHVYLGKHNDDAWYNVIDDVTPHYLKHWREFIGAQRDWTSNCKYAKPKEIKGGIPTIILCNPGELSSYKYFLEKIENTYLFDWTKSNAKFFYITESLFSTSDGPSFDVKLRMYIAKKQFNQKKFVCDCGSTLVHCNGCRRYHKVSDANDDGCFIRQSDKSFTLLIRKRVLRQHVLCKSPLQLQSQKSVEEKEFYNYCESLDELSTHSSYHGDTILGPLESENNVSNK